MSEADAETMREHGAPEEEIAVALAGERQVLWPRNRRALRLFRLCVTQWHWVETPTGARWAGLNYEGVATAARLAGLDIPPPLFRDLQHCERAALAFYAERARA